jgi:DNA primase
VFTQANIFSSYKEQTDFLNKITKLYQHSLIENLHVREYLSEERKISLEMQIKFKIGYAPNSDALLDFMVLNNIDQELLYKTGILKIVGDSAYDYFNNRVMFPLFDVDGSVIGFSGRVWDKSVPTTAKFVNSPDTELYKKSLHIYGLNFAKSAIRQQGFAWLVEGIPDVIACHSAGIVNAVSGGGTMITEHQLLILRYFTNNIAICFDNDTAGKAALNRLKSTLLSLKFNFVHKFLTTFKDPDELLRESDPESLKNELTVKFPIV